MSTVSELLEQLLQELLAGQTPVGDQPAPTPVIPVIPTEDTTTTTTPPAEGDNPFFDQGLGDEAPEPNLPFEDFSDLEQFIAGLNTAVEQSGLREVFNSLPPEARQDFIERFPMLADQFAVLPPEQYGSATLNLLNQIGGLYEPPQATTFDLEELNPSVYTWLRGFLQETFGLDASTAGAFLREQANRLQSENPIDYLGDQEFATGAQRRANGSTLLPRRFRDEEHLYLNFDSAGPVPVPVSLTPPPQVMGPATNLNITIDDPVTQQMLRENLDPTDAPFIPRFEWQTLLNMARPRPTGSGTAEMRFDESAVRERIRSEWRALMLEEPRDIEAEVQRYIAEAKRMRAAINVEAWVLDRLRDSPRFKLLYDRKPGFLGEREYMASLMGVSGQAGVLPSTQVRYTQRAAAAGQTAGGLAASILRTPEGLNANAGLFSRQLANTLSGLGALGRG